MMLQRGMQWFGDLGGDFEFPWKLLEWTDLEICLSFLEVYFKKGLPWETPK